MKIRLDLKLLKVMVLIILLFISIFIFGSNGSNMKEVLNFTPVQELYKSITITLLMPNVNEAISNYYKKYLKVSPREDSYSLELLEAERIENNAYWVKFKASPYIGPHNSVGLDYLTIKIEASGNVVLESFEHLESYNIPPHLSEIIIKWAQIKGTMKNKYRRYKKGQAIK